VPLPAGDCRDLDEEPLAGDVLEAGLDDTELHRTAGVDEDFRQAGGAAGTDLTVHTLAEVEDAGPDGRAPAHVPEAVLRVVEGERALVVRVGRVAHEAAGRVRVEADHEEEREVVRVPERLEALGPDLVVRGRVHENHDEQHEVTGDATRLGVVDLLRELLADLCSNGRVSMTSPRITHRETYGCARR
jgi:hypothetical protein